MLNCRSSYSQGDPICSHRSKCCERKEEDRIARRPTIKPKRDPGFPNAYKIGIRSLHSECLGFNPAGRKCSINSQDDVEAGLQHSHLWELNPSVSNYQLSHISSGV